MDNIGIDFIKSVLVALFSPGGKNADPKTTDANLKVLFFGSAAVHSKARKVFRMQPHAQTNATFRRIIGNDLILFF